MLVGFEAFPRILNIDRVINKLVENDRVDWDLIDANDGASEVLFTLYQVEPGVLPDVFYLITLFWVSV